MEEWDERGETGHTLGGRERGGRTRGGMKQNAEPSIDGNGVGVHGVDIIPAALRR